MNKERDVCSRHVCDDDDDDNDDHDDMVTHPISLLMELTKKIMHDQFCLG